MTMTAKHGPEEALEAPAQDLDEAPEEISGQGLEQDAREQGAEQGLEQDAPEEAPPGASSDDPDQRRTDGAGQPLPLDLDELTARAEKADAYLALAQRTQADFENYRRRAVREAGLAQERGVAKLARELLPALDHLDLALQAAGEEHSQLAEGIRLVQSDLLSALQRVGVEPFSSRGEQFDPQYHEAVAQQPVEGVDSGLVAEVFQQGYRLGDSVLRPARVLVAA
ncbi:MAG: nucleotide exchange factor GrpE [Elusimicrobia bacterium]|nr:nucleotide exchange factor GrpE [Elusimicrobiota bacterium]